VANVKALSLLVSLPLLLGMSLGIHFLVARAIKGVAWLWSPLATSEPEAFRYERAVYHTAATETMQVIAAALVAGLLFWWGANRGSGWFWAAGALALAGAVALDLLRWERVSVSANNLWFQRGFGGKVHQVAIENIHDLAVEESEVRGFTLRHGIRNRLCRLRVRMTDKRVIALPKTDAYKGLDDVEAVANHLRARLQLSGDRQSLQRASKQASEAAQAVASRPPDQESELRRELKRLRRGALAPEVPKAVTLKRDG
jgi:hypothetical protein